MNVFSDLHHLDLYHSLQLLFEKRLGWNLYRPIGMEWYTEKYWSVYNHPDTAKQYLLDGYIPKDGTPPLNDYSHLENGIHVIKDNHNNITQKAITLEQFKDMPIDIVIASIPSHVKLFRELIAKYKPKAKFIFQMGNMFNEIPELLRNGLVTNCMASTKAFPVPNGVHAVFYHQEFDTTIFKPSFSSPEKLITSFINILPRTGHAEKYYSLKSDLMDYEFRSYGSQTDDGVIGTTREMAQIMQKSAFGFHAKYMGDGFGHVLYNWFACGRPIVTCISDYKDKLGGELLIPNETCLDFDILTIYQLGDIIRDITPEKYQWMAQRAHEVFLQHVNYDEEEKKLRSFLENLQ